MYVFYFKTIKLTIMDKSNTTFFVEIDTSFVDQKRDSRGGFFLNVSQK